MSKIKITTSIFILFKILLIIFLIMHIWFITSCTTTTSSSSIEKKNVETIPFTHPEYNVYLEYPADWFYKNNDGLLFATVSSFDIAADGGAGLAILRYTEKDLQTEFKNFTLPSLIKVFLTEINADLYEMDTVMIRDWEGEKADFTISGEVELAGEIIICQVDQHIYVFMAITNPAELLKEYTHIFNTIYESVDFRGSNSQK